MKAFIDFIIWILKHPIHVKTPYEKLKKEFLDTYGKFSLNRIWQLERKIKNRSPRTPEENLFIRVCLLYVHSNYKESGLIIDDEKFYEVPKDKSSEQKIILNKKNFISKEKPK